jgi:hypothetical protein
VFRISNLPIEIDFILIPEKESYQKVIQAS